METKQLYKLFDRKYEKEVRPFIEESIPRNRFSEPVFYILDNFQLRRFRSAFPLIFAEEYQIPKEKVLPIAAASELIFTIALVQDDIIDGDKKRGKIPAAHIKYGTENCIASSDYMHAHVSRMLASLRKKDINPKIVLGVLDSFTDANERLYRSFMAERLEANNFGLPLKAILETYKDKTIQGTNSLFCSTVVCTGNNRLAGVIQNYSYDLAVAGQIKNDIYDATSYLENRGYSDLENSYITYIIRKLLDSTSETEKEELTKRILARDDEYIIGAIKSKNIIQLCLDDCNTYVKSAISRVKGRFSANLEEILLTWAEGNRKFSRKI